MAVSKTQFVNEGRIWEYVTQPYEIAYRTITPKATECSNLLVPVCLSASHVGFCSLRLESTWMQLGNSAGIAAVLAVQQKKAVQAVATNDLQEKLKDRGVILNVNHQVWEGRRDLPK